MRKNTNKLKNLVLYIIKRFNNDNLTPTKLQKLLYFCDFEHYHRKGIPITNYLYRKNYHGPTIMELPDILEELKADSKIKFKESKTFYNNPKTNFQLLDSSIESEKVFSDSELLVIDRINNEYLRLKPNEIEAISHEDVPYLATEILGQVINYELVHYRDDNACDDDEAIDEDAKKYFTSSEFQSIIRKVSLKLSPSS